MPQSLGLYEDLTVAENLAFSAAAYGSQDATLEGDLAEARDTLVGDLPLGLRRRAAFAIALGHHPDLLVLDEPTSGVDPLQRARLWETIRASAEQGAGVLVTTHHLAEAEQCDRLVVLAGGRVVAAGSLAEIVGDTTAAEVRTRPGGRLHRPRQAGLPVSLVGRTSASPERRWPPSPAAGDADVPAEVAAVRASFEETFVVRPAERPRTRAAPGTLHVVRCPPPVRRDAVCGTTAVHSSVRARGLVRGRRRPPETSSDQPALELVDLGPVDLGLIDRPGDSALGQGCRHLQGASRACRPPVRPCGTAGRASLPGWPG